MTPLQIFVEELANDYKWNWRRMSSDRSAANAVLQRLAELEIIKHQEHPLGGHIWIVDGMLFGRLDGIER